MDGLPGVTDCLDQKLRFDPLGSFDEHEYGREIQVSIVCHQVHVLKQPYQIIPGIREILFVRIPQKVAKPQFVELVDSRLGGQFVGMKLIAHLEKPPQFFFGLNAATVASSLDPDNPIAVEVGFVQAL